MSNKALLRHLEPITPFLQMDGVTEICINKPNEMYVEKRGEFIRYDVEEFDYHFLMTLAGLVAEFNQKDFPTPLLSSSLPDGERIQFVINPACEKNNIICSIRRQQMRNMSLEDYVTNGAFDESTVAKSSDNQLHDFFHQQNIYGFIKQAIHEKKNILISGGTGTGKTTFLNACLKYIPVNERLITVEDTREVNVTHPNVAHLLFNEEDKQISALNIFKTCLRLRPDRIFLSELRGAEVWPYLRAANSGHPGSLSTVHADTPEGAITQLVFMMQQAGSTSSEERIRDYVKTIVHVVIQLKRDAKRFMQVSDIWFEGENLRK